MQWVIIGLINEVADVFMRENPDAIKKIETDNAFRMRHDYFDDVKNYIAEGISQRLGYSPSA